MKNFKESPERKPTPSKSLNDLITLILKLNDKLREKISPRSRANKEGGAGQAEVVIIIMNNEEGKVSSPAKKPRTRGEERLKGVWIENLCKDIERGNSPRKKS